MTTSLRPSRLLLAVALGAATLAASALPAAAAPRSTSLSVQRAAGPMVDVRRAPFDGRTTSVDGAARPLDGRPRLAGSTASTFIVSYTGFTHGARKAFQSAVDYWQDTIVSSVPIRVQARFADLPGNVLGSAGAIEVLRGFSGARSNTWYPVALANKMAGVDLSPSRADIVADFDNAQPWFFGLDNVVPAGRISFRSVVLHELGHGLGFFGSMRRTSDGKGSWGLPDGRPVIFDRFTETGAGTPLLSLQNGSTALGKALVSKNLWAEGSGLPRTKLFAPATFQSGSSYSHWDEARYGRGHIDSLMTPTIGFGEGIAVAGPRTLALFTAMGWGDPAPAGCQKPHDLTGDGLNDILGVDTDGRLLLLPGNGAGSFQQTLLFTGDWAGTNLLAVSPDFNGDGCTDFVVRVLDNVWLYASDGSGGFDGSALGAFPSITALLAPGDVTGDGDADLLMRQANGTLVRLAGDGEGHFGSPMQMATGWGGYTEIVAPGDFDKDGNVDLLVRGTANGGTLRLFRGNGTGGLVSPSIVVGTGWNDFDELLSPRDFSGDGASDLLGRTPDGDLVLLRGTGTGTVRTPSLQVGAGFDVFGVLD